MCKPEPNAITGLREVPGDHKASLRWATGTRKPAAWRPFVGKERAELVGTWTQAPEVPQS